MQIDLLQCGRYDPSDVDEAPGADHPWKLKSRWATAFSEEDFCSAFCFVLFWALFSWMDLVVVVFWGGWRGLCWLLGAPPSRETRGSAHVAKIQTPTTDYDTHFFNITSKLSKNIQNHQLAALQSAYEALGALLRVCLCVCVEMEGGSLGRDRGPRHLCAKEPATRQPHGPLRADPHRTSTPPPTPTHTFRGRGHLPPRDPPHAHRRLRGRLLALPPRGPRA